MLYALRNKEIYWYRKSLSSTVPVYVTSVIQADKFWSFKQLKQQLDTVHQAHVGNFIPTFIWTNIKPIDFKIWAMYHVNVIKSRKKKSKNKHFSRLRFKLKMLRYIVGKKINKI